MPAPRGARVLDAASGIAAAPCRNILRVDMRRFYRRLTLRRAVPDPGLLLGRATLDGCNPTSAATLSRGGAQRCLRSRSYEARFAGALKEGVTLAGLLPSHGTTQLQAGL